MRHAISNKILGFLLRLPLKIFYKKCMLHPGKMRNNRSYDIMQTGRNKEAPLCTSMVCPNETAPTVKLRITKRKHGL